MGGTLDEKTGGLSSGAPQLGDAELLGVYGGWYLVQDEFTAGYMDAAGNWLFRVNLMRSLAD